MEFYDNHKVKPESLTREESKHLDYWLQDEDGRHVRCIEGLLDQITKRSPISLILNGAIKRHQEELEGIIKTRKILKELFGL